VGTMERRSRLEAALRQAEFVVSRHEFADLIEKDKDGGLRCPTFRRFPPPAPVSILPWSNARWRSIMVHPCDRAGPRRFSFRLPPID
jgi:hypothetical protein